MLVLGSCLLIGAPTSSGVFFAVGLFRFFLGDWLMFCPNLFEFCFLSREIFWLKESFLLMVFVKFFGFSISWIGGFAGLLAGAVEGLRYGFLSRLKFELFFSLKFDCGLFGLLTDSLPFNCPLDCEPEILLFWELFCFVFEFSWLFIGLINRGFLFKLPLEEFVWVGIPVGEDFSKFCFSYFLSCL